MGVGVRVPPFARHGEGPGGDARAFFRFETVDADGDLFTLVSADRHRVIQQGRVSLLAVQLFERLPSQPLITVPQVVDSFATTKPTADRAIEFLQSVGILTEATGKRRNRVYAYQAYLDRFRTAPSWATTAESSVAGSGTTSVRNWIRALHPDAKGI